MTPIAHNDDPLALGLHCRLSDKAVRLMRPSLYSFTTTHEAFEQLSARLFGLVKQGVVKPAVYKEYPLAAASDAHRDLEGRATTGKLLLRP